MDWLEKRKRRKAAELEEKLTEQVIRENEEAEEEALSEGVPASVVTYMPSTDDSGIPRMEIIVENFTCRMMPEPGSIIWIATKNGVLRPHKVTRYDYVENGNLYDSIRVYIVTEPATSAEVIPNPRYREF